MNRDVISSLHLEVVNNIVGDALAKLYEVKSLYKKIFLKRTLYTLWMSKSTLMTKHIKHEESIEHNIKGKDMLNFCSKVYPIHIIISS